MNSAKVDCGNANLHLVQGCDASLTSGRWALLTVLPNLAQGMSQEVSAFSFPDKCEFGDPGGLQAWLTSALNPNRDPWQVQTTVGASSDDVTSPTVMFVCTYCLSWRRLAPLLWFSRGPLSVITSGLWNREDLNIYLIVYLFILMLFWSVHIIALFFSFLSIFGIPYSSTYRFVWSWLQNRAALGNEHNKHREELGKRDWLCLLLCKI